MLSPLNKLQINRPHISNIIVNVSTGVKFSKQNCQNKMMCHYTKLPYINGSDSLLANKKKSCIVHIFNYFDALFFRFENVPVDRLQPVRERVDGTVRDPRRLQHHGRAESARLQIHYRSYCGFFLRKTSIYNKYINKANYALSEFKILFLMHLVPVIT